MQVVKRDGTYTDFDVEKIKKVIEWACKDLEADAINLEGNVTAIFKDDISTRDIQKNVIDQALKLCSIESPDWRYVAGRLLIMNLWKDVKLSRKSLGPSPSFDQIVSYQVGRGIYDKGIYDHYNTSDLHGVSNWIDETYDMEYDYAGATLMQKRYLLDGELPQESFLMIALLLASVEPEDLRLASAYIYFDALRKRKVSLATPLLLNLRRPNPNLSSCFIIAAEDSWDSIADTIKDIGSISKNAGGVGVNISRIRASGSWVNGTKNASGGIVPWISIFNSTAVAVNQQGKRAGAVTVSIDSWHLDMEDFLELQTESGDPRRKAYDIFPQVVVSDLFMERVQRDLEWTLFDPYEVRSRFNIELAEKWGEEFEEKYLMLEASALTLRKTVKAKDLFKKIMKSQIETGMPYLVFKDTINQANPNKDDGMIPGTNLCVAPETKILTDTGYHEIVSLVGQNVKVWNGLNFSETLIRKTGENQSLLKVELSNGETIECTPQHHFYIQNGYKKHTTRKVSAYELIPGDKLIKYELPVIEGSEEFQYAYTHGFYCGDGDLAHGKRPGANLYGVKQDLIPFLEIRKKQWSNGTVLIEREEDFIYAEPLLDRTRCKFHADMLPKFTVPTAAHTIESRLYWFAGLLDADGTVARNGSNESFQICSIDKSFLLSVRLMLQTLGVDSKVTLGLEAGTREMPDGKGGKKEYDCKKTYRLLVTSNGAYSLKELGLKTNRLVWSGDKPQRHASHFVKVESIKDEGRISDTYCFTEEERHMGMFNGVLTGQCVESYSNVVPHKLAHCCNLVSLNLDTIADVDLEHYCTIAVRILDNAIDLTTPPIAEAKAHNERYRTIGVGAMGLADWLASRDTKYSKSQDLVEKLFEDIAYYTFSESINLAAERGTFEAYDKSEFAKGLILCHDRKWFMSNSANPERWLLLFDQLEKHGIRNSQIQAIAPNTSSSLIQGCTASVLPVYNRFFFDKNQNGMTPIAPPRIKDKFWYYEEYKNIDVKAVVDVVSRIQKWTDTGISMELVFNMNKKEVEVQYTNTGEKVISPISFEQRIGIPLPLHETESMVGEMHSPGRSIDAKYIYETLMEAWQKGCKAVYYVRSIQKDDSITDSKNTCTTCTN